MTGHDEPGPAQLGRLPTATGHARLDLPPARLAEFRDLGVLYEETPDGAYLQVCTEVLGGRLFLAFVQRIGGYDGYGWTDAPVRMAAHRRRRLVRQGSRA